MRILLLCFPRANLPTYSHRADTSKGNEEGPRPRDRAPCPRHVLRRQGDRRCGPRGFFQGEFAHPERDPLVIRRWSSAAQMCFDVACAERDAFGTAAACWAPSATMRTFAGAEK